ncbi:hypothetical protein ACI0X9_003380 [Cronobacter turicensis]
MTDINVQEIFANSQSNAGMGELAKTMSALEKKPTSLRQITDLLAKVKKEHADIQFDEADVGRNNGFKVAPAWLYVEPGLNLRNVNVEHAAVFKTMWMRGSRIPPIVVKPVLVDGVTRLKVVDGHHRFAGLMAAIAEGAQIASVPVEEFTGNKAEEVFEMLKSSQGLALKPIERAEGFKRLRAWDISIEEIAAGSGNNVQTVRRSLLLADAEENVKKLVREEKVSADVVINLLVECKGTDRDVFEELQNSLEQAVKAGKNKVTARFVKSKKVTVKPKVVRETFTSLLPASNQIRSQIERVKTEDSADPEEVSIKLPADAARNLLAVLEIYEANQKAAAEQEDGAAIDVDVDVEAEAEAETEE